MDLRWDVDMGPSLLHFVPQKILHYEFGVNIKEYFPLQDAIGIDVKKMLLISFSN